jgi:hypothetical protein
MVCNVLEGERHFYQMNMIANTLCHKQLSPFLIKPNYVCIFNPSSGGHHGDVPHVADEHVYAAQFFGSIMWTWLAYRAYHDASWALLVRFLVVVLF